MEADQGEMEGVLGVAGGVAEVEDEGACDNAEEDVDPPGVVADWFVAGAVEEDGVGG